MPRLARSGAILAVLAAAVLVSLMLVQWGGSQNAAGFGSYFRGFKTRYPAVLGTALDTCGVCHEDPDGGGPRNPFGQAVEAELDAGKDIDEALAAIEAADSDGDGASNLEEINALTAPGDPADSPVVVTPTSVVATPTPPAGTPTPAAGTPTPDAGTPTPPAATPAPTATASGPPAGGGPPGGGIFDSAEIYVLLALVGLAVAIGAAFVYYYGLVKPNA